MQKNKEKADIPDMLYCVELQNHFRIMIITQEATNPISFKL